MSKKEWYVDIDEVKNVHLSDEQINLLLATLKILGLNHICLWGHNKRR